MLKTKKKYLFLQVVTILISTPLFAQTLIKDTSVEYIKNIVSDSEAIIKINQLLENKKNSIEIKANLQMKLALRLYSQKKYQEVLELSNDLIVEQEPIIQTFLPKLYTIKGSAYYYLFNVEKAIECFEKGIFWAEKVRDYPSLYLLCSNLGGMYIDSKRLQEAEGVLRKSIQLNEQNSNEPNRQLFLTKRLLGTVYHFKKNYKETEAIYKEAMLGLEKLNELDHEYIGVLGLYASLLIELHKDKEAFLLLEKAKKIQATSSNKKDLSFLYYTIGNAYKNTGNYSKGFEYLDSTYRNQLVEFQQAQTTAIAESEAKFGNEILKRDVQIANQKKQRLFFISALVTSLALLSWISFYYYQKRKDTKQKLILQQHTMDAYMSGEEKEKLRLSRELHDGIAQDLLALRFTFKQKGLDDDSLQEIDKIGTEVRNLSHQLMPLTLQMLGLIPALEEMCNKIFPNNNITHEMIVEGLENRLPLTLETSLYRIVQELVQNIIKHSKANHVLIQLIQKNNFVNLIVEDNGTGFDESKQQQGIGLNNVKSRVQMINGQLRYESAEGEGTVTIIRVPC